MPPTRYRILYVDPVKLRRDRAAEATRTRFDIVPAGTAAEASAVVTGTIHAVVLTLRQVEENGLVLGKKLREKFGPEPYFVVHGPSVPPKSPEERAKIAERHGVDTWAAEMIAPETLEVALLRELTRRYRSKETAQGKVDEIDDEPTWSSLLSGPRTWENMKKLLTKDITGKRK